MITATPAMPKLAPPIFLAVKGSSRSNKPATTAPNIAVVPFKIDASPLSICVCPQIIRENGMALLSAPITR
jgi:hypothetical protein